MGEFKGVISMTTKSNKATKRPKPTGEELAALEQRRQELEERRRLRASLKNGEVALHGGCVQAFERFARAAKQRPKKALSDASAQAYEGIWLEWLMFLVGVGVGWRAAKPSDVAAFLKTGLRPRSHARNSDAKVSTVTQARYGRILGEIYFHALDEDERHTSPVKLVGQEVPQSEAMTSLKLHGQIRERLRRQLPEAKDEKSARDRLVICLTLLEGMTCADIMGLELQDLLFKQDDTAEVAYGSEHASVEEMASWVRGYTGGPEGGGRLFTPEVAPRGVHLRGERKAQDRRLAFRATTRKSLRQWLEYRSEHRYALISNVVVLSLSRRMGKRDAGVTHRALFQICAAHIDQKLRGSGLLTEQEVTGLQHIGPNTLRNACLLQWMDDGVDAEEVRRRAGLKEARSLSRLADEHRDDGKHGGRVASSEVMA